MKKFFNFLNSVNLILDYCAALAVCLIFALYCSGRVGYFLMIALLLAPVASVLYTYIMARVIRVETSLMTMHYKKGAKVNLVIAIKGVRLPLPLMELEPEGIGSLECPEENIKISPALFAKRENSAEYTAVYSGAGYAGLKNCCMWDFFGILKFRIAHADKTLHLVGVLPHFIETPEAKEKLTKVLQDTSDVREYEESPFEKSGNFNGFPGYEHREYVPGDPVKRINYKLSARRDELYVRLSELQVNGRVVISLEQFLPAHIEQGSEPVFFQEKMEEAIALAALLLKNQFVVEFRYIENNAFDLAGAGEFWNTGTGAVESFELLDMDGLEILIQKLAYCRYYQYRE